MSADDASALGALRSQRRKNGKIKLMPLRLGQYMIGIALSLSLRVFVAKTHIEI
jgi:hypothetical protein